MSPWDGGAIDGISVTAGNVVDAPPPAPVVGSGVDMPGGSGLTDPTGTVSGGEGTGGRTAVTAGEPAGATDVADPAAELLLAALVVVDRGVDPSALPEVDPDVAPSPAGVADVELPASRSVVTAPTAGTVDSSESAASLVHPVIDTITIDADTTANTLRLALIAASAFHRSTADSVAAISVNATCWDCRRTAAIRSGRVVYPQLIRGPADPFGRPPSRIDGSLSIRQERHSYDAEES